MAEQRKIEDAKRYVRDTDNNTQVWALINVVGGKLKFARKGKEYNELLEHLGSADMSFAYAKIIIGDELSKREKFVLISWVGPEVSIVQKGKMMQGRLELDQIFDQRAKVIEASDLADLSIAKVKEGLIKAGGSDYGSSTS